MRSFSLLIFLITACFGAAQNLKCKSIPADDNFHPLDSILIEAESIQVPVDENFTYNPTTQMIRVFSDSDSVVVCYRILAEGIFENYTNRPISQYEPSIFENRKIVSFQENEPLFNFGGEVETNGFISRGVTFGNRQNLFVNSTLNLQLSGKINKNLNIEALITDQNIPFQPEGNTQQIRDFDNVYIKLFNDDFELIAGDVVLTNPFQKSYFLKYYKNVQGLQFNYRSKLGKWNSYTSLATSASKGKFASVAIEPREGVQGPYQLRAPNGERFVVVLANSEKVFLDGVLLERGFDRDYVVDYNLGQITFNTNTLLTQFSVLRVDYEYAEQFYSRTSSAVAQSLSKGSTEIRINHYREKDNTLTPFGFQPSESDLDFLRLLGDKIELSQVSGIDSVVYSPDRILYEKKDTLDRDGNVREIFLYSIDPSRAFFSVFFSEVGLGNGDYVLDNTTTNGQVFRWVSPQMGQSQGNYSPTRNVPLPIAKSMTTLGVSNEINSFESISNEIAISNVDLNLYSPLDDRDNQAVAWSGYLRSEGRSLGKGYKLSTSLDWEIDQAGFRAMDRYRPILFDRDWDVGRSDTTDVSDIIVSFRVGAKKNEDQRHSYKLIRRDRTALFEGWQHYLELNQKFGSLHLESDLYYLKNKLGEVNSEWVRGLTNLSFRKGKLIPGYIYSIDQNRQLQSDSVIASQMYFDAHELYLTNSDSALSRFRFSYQSRLDRAPFEGQLRDFIRSDNYRANFQRSFKNHEFDLTGSFRQVDNELNDEKEEWLNARVGWFGKFFKENITSRLTYQVGNVRELRRNFIFVEVGGNQGTHAWRDENGDGIKDLNEFYEAINPDEKQYAKFWVPTDDFISAFETRFQDVIDLKFPRSWRNATGFKGFLSRWNSRVSLNAHFKTSAEAISKKLNPFGLDLEDSDILFAASRWNYNLQYNQFNDGLGWEASRELVQRKQLLTNGFELSNRSEWLMRTRWRFNSEYTITLRNEWGRHLNSSDFLQNRNLDILRYGFGPEFTWQPSTALRFVGGYIFENRENQDAKNPVESDLNEWYARVTWNKLSKGNMNGQVRVVQIDYSGDLNSFVSYQMLDALLPGQNITWRFNWQQTLGKGIQITFQYNGRTSEGQAAIHTGTMIFTAFF